MNLKVLFILIFGYPILYLVSSDINHDHPVEKEENKIDNLTTLKNWMHDLELSSLSAFNNIDDKYIDDYEPCYSYKDVVNTMIDDNVVMYFGNGSTISYGNNNVGKPHGYGTFKNGNFSITGLWHYGNIFFKNTLSVSHILYIL